jgi:hypothetical protein
MNSGIGTLILGADPRIVWGVFPWRSQFEVKPFEF